VSWTTPTGAETGITAGIDDFGALLVRTEARIERIVAGELTWL
jgi:biotin-(acetyl-CoA carboxylase) ligase